jgi:hypothetical protein
MGRNHDVHNRISQDVPMNERIKYFAYNEIKKKERYSMSNSNDIIS